MNQKFKKINSCRISNSTNLIDVLHLGMQPLANSLQGAGEANKEEYPLSISFCPESSLLQLNETVNKEVLFEHYVWVSGTSETARIYAVNFTERIQAITGVKENDLIVEIASNDGTFLKPFIANGFRNVLGIDPARNLAEKANKQGINTLPEFWNSTLAGDVTKKYEHAKVVIARNVIPHVSELMDVIEGIKIVLQDDGVGVIEFHDAARIQDELHYDSIYHEHLCYFSIKSISFLLSRYELCPFHIEKSKISGGSWVIFFSKEKARLNRSAELENAIHAEEEQKVNDLKTWQQFADLTEKHRQKSLDILHSVRGKNIVGFGSSARSQTYLNYCGINSSDIAAIVDNNPLKQGLYAPGSLIPIVDFESGMKLKPDLIFILAWNFRDEIARECINAGYKGQFLVPFPHEPYFFEMK